MTAFLLKHLEKYRFPSGGRCLLAVSGGSDSMVMCHLFLEAGIPYAIGHCNFQLRGKESDGDEAFVRKFAEKHQLSFHSIRFPGLKEKAGIQEQARRLRYNWFEKIRKEHHYTRVCTAHHRDDAVETFLFHLVRGTGIAGLKGIPVEQQAVFRPLLFAWRSDLEHYAKKNKIKFRTDRSNKSLIYTRNRFRKQVLPLLEKIIPGAKRNLAMTMEQVAGAAQVYQDTVWTLFNEIAELKNETVKIQKKKWLESEHRDVLLYEYLSAFGFNATQVKDIARAVHAQPGKIFRSETHMLLNDRAHFLLSPLRHEAGSDAVLIREDFGKILSPIPLEFGKRSGPFSSRLAVLDKEKLRFPMEVRRWRDGDYFYPTGLNGRKKLSDLLTDMKIPRTEKQDIFVITSGGQIVWVAGYRIDKRFAATERTTEYYSIERL
ncbi:MAG: tRNA lysidine(34) synthetase TilS [Bacteroidia bacterium]|nr:tRNA lysidine(34) synthetase TilS [Bacteroidia bacterium]